MTVITGAAGFIGRNTVAELNRRGNTNLLLVDDLGTQEKWKNLVGLHYADMLPIHDFLQRIQTNDLPDIDGIVHLGACSATTERNADYLLTNNYAYTRTLAEWSMAHGARFVYASSAATYGNGDFGYNDADDLTTKKLQPLNMYGFSKHMFDLCAMQHNWFSGKHPIAGIKYFNVYGPYEDHKEDMRSVVCKSFDDLQNGATSIKLFRSYKPAYNDGEQMRDFVYVKDAVNVTLWLLDNPTVGGLYNCGSGKARTWLDLAKALYAALGQKPSIEFIDMPESLRNKYQYFTEATMQKIRMAGYPGSSTSLEDGVHEYVTQYLIPRAEGQSA